MKAQSPAQGILKKHSWGDTKMYHVVCECGSSEHAHDVWIEASDFGVDVCVYVTVKSPWWSMSRFKQLWSLITKGYIEQETALTMTEQTALNYAKALEQAVQDVKVFKATSKTQTNPTTKLAQQGDCV